MVSASELNIKGAEYFTRGDYEGAKLHYLASLLVDPNYDKAFANLGQISGERSQLKGALAYFRRAVSIDPKNWRHWDNLGNILMRLSDYKNAEDAFKVSIDLSPDSRGTYYNLALNSYRQNRATEAIEYANRSIALGNWGPQIASDVAHFHLHAGKDLSAALEKYETRWIDLVHLPAWDYHIPEWQGESLLGKNILLHGEQGFGDDLMGFRFHRNLVALGANVTIGASPPLISLFEAQGLRVLNSHALTAEQMREFHFHTPTFGCLRHLALQWSDITGEPYIKAPGAKKFEMNDGGLLKIGICWASGKRGGAIDWRRRHSDLTDWLQLAILPKVKLYSLQGDDTNDEIGELGVDGLICDLMPQVSCWADTADLISQLDLVISVDTAVAHLAGALGTPVWMLSQFSRCWRWQQATSSSGRPWYNSMKIILQSAPEDWADQLDYARNLLEGNSGAFELAAD